MVDRIEKKFDHLQSNMNKIEAGNMANELEIQEKVEDVEDVEEKQEVMQSHPNLKFYRQRTHVSKSTLPLLDNFNFCKEVTPQSLKNSAKDKNSSLR